MDTQMDKHILLLNILTTGLDTSFTNLQRSFPQLLSPFMWDIKKIDNEI